MTAVLSNRKRRNPSVSSTGMPTTKKIPPSTTVMNITALMADKAAEKEEREMLLIMKNAKKMRRGERIEKNVVSNNIVRQKSKGKSRF